jgi:uncharacterized tellurite resistance protein B-like protein
MFKFLKKKDINLKQNNNLIDMTASLLVHAAKMDENYTDKEKNIIKKTLIEFGCNKENVEKTIKNAEIRENESNHILDFTKEIKNADNNFKEKLIETLWKIIYSDKNSDIYETSLMRKLSGLLYLDNKVVGDIKEKVKKSLE